MKINFYNIISFYAFSPNSISFFEKFFKFVSQQLHIYRDVYWQLKFLCTHLKKEFLNIYIYISIYIIY